MQVTDFALFPTRVVTIQFPDVGPLNERLEALFRTRAELAGDFAMHPDSLNLLRLADECPAVAALRGMFLDGLRRWLAAEGVIGDGPEAVDMVMFCNYAGKGESTAAHNHSADLVGIYYARTAEHAGRPALFRPGIDGDEDDYFAAEDGALLLHDPRFNANLAALRSRDYAKVFPRPGLMLIFPGYLWHSVTPHLGDFKRLALSVNFTLRWPGAGAAAQTWPL